MDDTLPVVKGSYIKGKVTKAAAQRLTAHFKYNHYRKFGPEETREDRYIFSQEEDNINRKDAVQDVLSHTHSRLNYHKIILSPADYEHIDDYRQWTRDVMRELQERKQIRLHWYAVVQAHEREHTTTPHVHLVLAGAGEDYQTGNQKLVRMDRPDYAFLREQSREQGNYEFYQEQTRQL